MQNISFFSSSPVSTNTLSKIRTFQNLAIGWHFGSGGPIEAEVISRAIEIHCLFLLLGMTHTNAFAGENGEVLVTAYKIHDYIGVTIEPTFFNKHTSKPFCGLPLPTDFSSA